MIAVAGETSVRYLVNWVTLTPPTWWLTVTSLLFCLPCPTWSIRDHKNLWIPTTIRTSCFHQPPIWSQYLQFLPRGEHQLRNRKEFEIRAFLPRLLRLHLHQLPQWRRGNLNPQTGAAAERRGRSLRSVTVVVSRSSVYPWELWQNTRSAKIAVKISVQHEWIIITNNIHSDRRQ